MSNLDDDDGIKQFFNKVAKHYNINYDEGDWQKMEKMLDAENVRTASARSTRWKVAAISFALLSLFLMVYFFVAPSNTPAQKEMTTEKPVSANAPESTDGANDPTNSASNKDLTASEKQQDVSIKSDVLSNIDKNQSKRSKSRKTKILTPKNSLQKDPSFSNVENLRNEEIALSTDSSKSTESKESIGVNSIHPEAENIADASVILSDQKNRNAIALDSSANDIARINKEFSQSTILGDSATLTSDASKDTTKIDRETVDAKFVEPDDKQKKKEEDKGPIYSRWSVSLAVAPDFSSTEIFKQASAGSAWGITIQYDISKRFTLQTGALLTSKKYWRKGDEYTNIRPGYWVAKTNGVIPERIDGGCSVLEIPFALRYTLLNIKESRIQVSGGASSYMMLDESYSFTFENPNPNATQTFQSSETKNYFLSIGSVSIAYERMIHSKLSIGIEPYAKIPFTKIGWAKLPLYSMGAYLTLRYRILK